VHWAQHVKGLSNEATKHLADVTALQIKKNLHSYQSMLWLQMHWRPIIMGACSKFVAYQLIIINYYHRLITDVNNSHNGNNGSRRAKRVEVIIIINRYLRPRWQHSKPSSPNDTKKQLAKMAKQKRRRIRTLVYNEFSSAI